MDTDKSMVKGWDGVGSGLDAGQQRGENSTIYNSVNNKRTSIIVSTIRNRTHSHLVPMLLLASGLILSVAIEAIFLLPVKDGL